MNKIYRVVWNRERGCLVVASEFAQSDAAAGAGGVAYARTARAAAPARLAVALALALGGMAGLGLSAPALAANDAYCVDENGNRLPAPPAGTGDNRVICGPGAEANGQHAIAIGSSAKTFGTGSGNMAIGHGATVQAGTAGSPISDAIAIGTNARAQGTASIAVGKNAVSAPWSATKHPIGSGPLEGVDAIAVGNNARAGNDFSVALGSGAVANKRDSIAIGHGARVEWTGAAADDVRRQGIAIGAGAFVLDAAGAGGLALGAHAGVEGGNRGLAIGTGARANGTIAIAIGGDARASGDTNVAVGEKAQTNGFDSSAFGIYAMAGRNHTQNGQGGVMSASAFGAHAVAQGRGSTSLGAGSLVFGQGSGGFSANSPVTSRVYGDPKDSTAFSLIGGTNNFSIGNRNVIGATSSDNVALGNDIRIGATGASFVEHRATKGTTNDLRYYVPTFANQVAISNAVAIGSAASVRANDTLALGREAAAGVVGAVALGAGSVAATAAGIDGYMPADVTAAEAEAIRETTSTSGAVSVGDAESRQFRQITGVAAGTQASDAVNVAQLQATQTHYYSVNDNGTPAGNYDNEGATGRYSLAAGTDAKATAQNATAVGNQASAQGGNSTALGAQTHATGDGSVALGSGANASGDHATVVGLNATGTDDDVALGAGALTDVPPDVTGTQPGTTESTGGNTAVGAQAGARLVGGQNALLGLGAGAGMTGNRNVGSGLYALAETRGENNVGTGTGAGAAVVGDNNVAIGNLAGTASYIDAAGNPVSVEATVSNGVSIGHEAKALQDYAIAIGSGSRATHYDARSSIAMGHGAIVEGHQSVAIGSGAHTGPGGRSIAIGHESDASFGTIAIGNEAGAEIIQDLRYPSSGNLLIGYAAGKESQGSNNAYVGWVSGLGSDGSMNAALGLNSGLVSQGNANTMLGAYAGTAAEGNQNVMIGFGAGLGGFDPEDPATADTLQADNTVNIGTSSFANANDAVALGHGARAAVAEGDVALGAGSETRVVTPTSEAAVGGITYGGFAGSNPASAASIGAVGAERQLQNVAAGQVSADSTDAINGSQLFATQTVIGNVADVANRGWDLTTNQDAGSLSNVAPSDTVDFSTDGNVVVGNAGNNVTFGLADSITIGTAAPVTIDGDAGTIGGLTNLTFDPNAFTSGQSATEDQLAQVSGELADLADTPITFAGDAGSTDRRLGQTLAVTGGADAADLTDGNIGVVASDEGLSVQLSRNLTGLESVMVGGTTINNEGLTIVGGPSVTVGGIDAGNTRIINVAPGVDGTDAVNVDQLTEATDGLVTAGMDFAGNQGEVVHRDLGQTLAITGEATTAGEYSGANLRTVTDPTTGAIHLQMAESPQFGEVVVNVDGSGRITGVAPGALGAGSTDVVNGSQLFAVGNSTALALGGGSHFDPATGTVIAELVVGDVTYDNVQDALLAVNSVAGAGWYLQANGGPAHNVAPNGTVNVVDGSNTRVVQEGGQLQVNVVDAPTFAGMVTAAGGLTVGAGQTVDMGGNVVTNVAAGEVSATSTDAVNGSQLHATNQRIDVIDGRVTNLENTVGGIVGDVTDLQTGAAGMFQVSQDHTTAPSATGTNSAAGGASAVASGDNSTAVGNDSQATGAGSTAMGQGATASGSSSVAIGSGSVALEDNVVSVGRAGAERRITNVAAGVNPTDAVNVSQLQQQAAGGVQYDRNADGSVDYTSVTLNPNGSAPTTIRNVAAGVAPTDAVNVGQLESGLTRTLNQANEYTDMRFNELGQDVWEMRRAYRGGTASAMAMAGLPQAYLPGKSMLAVGMGGFQGEYGMAVGLSGISDNGRWVYKAQASGNTTREWGFSVGAGIQW